MTEKAYYPISDLYLFPLYDRESYRKAFGEQARPFDPNRRIKRWFDPDAKSDPYEYTYFDFGSKEFRKNSISLSEARQLNLPGKYEYEVYKPEPTPAVIDGPSPSFAPQPLREDYLSYAHEAEALARELGGKATESVLMSSVFSIKWRGEERRMWVVEIDGQQYNVGLLLKDRHSAGKDAPGSWKMTKYGPIWVPDPQYDGSMDARPEIPVPCRELRSNEYLYTTPFSVTVYRTDLESPYNTKTSFEDRVLTSLERIESALRELSKR